VSNHHHNPLDPRDPVGAYVLYNIVTGDDNGRRGRRERGPDGTPGCGCLFLMLLVAAIIYMLAFGD
jgi:hypothetical protein